MIIVSSSLGAVLPLETLIMDKGWKWLTKKKKNEMKKKNEQK